MKKFLALTLTALILAVVMSLSLFAFNTTAATENTNPKNVIFISDDYSYGDGSGRDADNPLRPVPVDPHFIQEKQNEYNYYGKYYLESPLYQAAEKLVDTGGTIVICGPVNIDRTNTYGSSWTAKDFYMPESEHHITITSKYNNVDYSKPANGGAYLHIAAPAHLTLGSPVTMEYLTIKTTTDFNPAWEYTTETVDGKEVKNYTLDANGFRIRVKDENGNPAFELNDSGKTIEYGNNRLICANGYKLVMGNGITCLQTEGANNGYRFPTIVGGKRHGDVESDTNIVIMSGTYGHVCGSIYGAYSALKDEAGNDLIDDNGKIVYNHYTQKGDVNITILNGVFRGYIVASSPVIQNTVIDGDVNIYIGPSVGTGSATRPQFGGSIYAAGANQFASDDCKVYIKIMGGRFNVEGTPDTPAGVKVYKKNSSNSGANIDCVTYPASEYVLDLSELANVAFFANTANPAHSADFPANTWIKTSGFDEIIYPTSWLTKVECATDVEGTAVPPTKIDTYINGISKPTEAIVKATYTNPVTSETGIVKYVKYDERSGSFTSDLRNTTTAVWYSYGGKVYQSATITNYVEAPTVELLGARLKAKGEGGYPKQALRFVAEYNLPENVTVNEAGVLALKSYLVKDESKLTLDGTFGNIKYVASAGDTYSYQGNTRFECTIADINQREFVQDYTARAYVKYTVGDTEYIAYSDAIVRNPYEMAKEAVANTEVETAATISHLNTKLISVANNFDVKNQYVSDEELADLRRSVVDYMELQANIEWKPKYSFAIYNNTGDKAINDVRYQNSNGTYVEGVSMAGIFEAGKTYYGMPYTSSSVPGMQTSNYESFERLLDLTYEMDKFTAYSGRAVPYSESAWNYNGSLDWLFTGKKDTLKMANWMYSNLTDAEKDAAYINYTIIPGSHCSKAVFSAWNIVLNNTTTTSRLTATYRIVPGSNSNVFAVGDYNYKSNNLVIMTEENNTKQIIESNGVKFEYVENGTNSDGTIKYKTILAADSDNSKMYAAYAALKPGDGLIHYTDSGHTRLVVDVDYNKDNPGASIVKTLECANWSAPHLRMADPQSAESGKELATVYDNNSCWKVREYSFDNLLITTYIPSRITELSTGLVDKLSVVMTDTDIADGTLNGTIKSNMQIVSVDVTVKGDSINKNEIIYLTSEAMHLAEYDITELDLTTRFGLTVGNEYNITLKVGTPGYVSKYEANSTRPNDVDDDNNIAVDYTPTFTTIWTDMAFVAPAALPVE